jgi:hypothetical protein
LGVVNSNAAKGADDDEKGRFFQPGAAKPGMPGAAGGK